MHMTTHEHNKHSTLLAWIEAPYD